MHVDSHIFNRFSKSFALLVILGLLPFTSDAFGSPPISVTGWNLADMSSPLTIGDDPVFGRLACPPLSRLNLLKNSSEPVLLRSVNSKEATWSLSLKNEIFWWDGSPVSVDHLATFVKDNLKEIVRKRGSGNWTAPNFTVTTAKSKVKITWDNRPEFSPYIFNGVALFRKASNQFSYECAGLYKATIKKDGYILTANSGYKSPRHRPTLKFPIKQRPKSGPSIHFAAAKDFSGSPWKRLSDEKISCKRPIVLPLVSVIYWNTESGITTSAEIRKLLTKLTPRGTFYRSISGYLGDLISGLILRVHPGYNRKVMVRSYDIIKVANELKKLGFKRKDSESNLLDSSGKEVKLTITTLGASSGILEKTITDTFALAGIKLAFTNKTSSSVNGVLTGVWVDWPMQNFSSEFHSKAKNPVMPWNLSDNNLDSMLNDYALSTTTRRPDFSKLKKIHRAVYDIEPMTILLQHNACIKYGGGFKPRTLRVDINDPDWFRKLIL